MCVGKGGGGGSGLYPTLLKPGSPSGSLSACLPTSPCGLKPVRPNPGYTLVLVRVCVWCALGFHPVKVGRVPEANLNGPSTPLQRLSPLSVSRFNHGLTAMIDDAPYCCACNCHLCLLRNGAWFGCLCVLQAGSGASAGRSHRPHVSRILHRERAHGSLEARPSMRYQAPA
jgi:hypothetical protein